MLDDKQPNDIFNGKDDLYRLLRETRTAVNTLMLRVEAIEVLLSGNDSYIDESDAEESMANTKGNSGMVPKVYGRKSGKKK